MPNIAGINIGTTVGSILDSTPYLPPPPPPQDMLKIEPKARRKFNVPAKYRCRVCHKIYLGDRKMAKHMKAFPTHGPSGKEHFDKECYYFRGIGFGCGVISWLIEFFVHFFA